MLSAVSLRPHVGDRTTGCSQECQQTLDTKLRQLLSGTSQDSHGSVGRAHRAPPRGMTACNTRACMPATRETRGRPYLFYSFKLSKQMRSTRGRLSIV